jgi:hypothetical protein
MSYTQIGGYGGYGNSSYTPLGDRVDGSCDAKQCSSIVVIFVGVCVTFANVIAGVVIIGCGVAALIGSTIWRCRHKL